MQTISHAITDAGRRRNVNEDRCHTDDGRRFYVVADGLGGHYGAATASKLAVEAAVRAAETPLPEEDEARDNWLKKIVEEANEAIKAGAGADPMARMMSSTLTTVSFNAGRVAIAHIGDCRVYRLRGGEFTLLTEDHTVAFEQYKGGFISKEELPKHPGQKLLTRSLGVEASVAPDLLVDRVEPGDIYFMCSDGINKELDDEQVREILTAEPSVKSACARAVELANAHGGRDNITAVVIRILDAPNGS